MQRHHCGGSNIIPRILIFLVARNSIFCVFKRRITVVGFSRFCGCTGMRLVHSTVYCRNSTVSCAASGFEEGSRIRNGECVSMQNILYKIEM